MDDTAPHPPPAATAGSTNRKEPRFRFFQPTLTPSPEHRPTRLDPTRINWRNGLIVRGTNWLGDTVISLPAVYKLRTFLPPGVGLFVACPNALAPVWEAAPWVDRVIGFPGKRLGGKSLADLHGLLPGVALVLPNSFGAAFDLFHRDISTRVGRSGRWRRPLLTHALPPIWPKTTASSRHQLSELLELIAVFGDVTWDTQFPALRLPDPGPVLAKFGLAADLETRPLLGLAPGAAYGVAKQWSPQAFRAVATWWCQRGGRVVALGTRREAAVADEVVAGLDGAQNLAGRTTLHEVMAILAACRCAVANDSGIMHLAGALNTPGVAVFGCTDPVLTGPVAGQWVLLMEKLGCAPCFKRRCQITGSDCLGLRQVSSAEVCAAVEYILANTSPRPPFA